MLDKTYQPENFEKNIYQTWLKRGYFGAQPDSRKMFSIVMPPPNVTGKAHIGHALNNTIQDILVRTKRMQGFNTLWVPGTDHAALATEEVLVRTLKAEGHTKEEIGRDEFLKRGWQWYKRYGGIIVQQLQALGISADWDRLKFTMDDNLCRAVRGAFCHYYNKGLIYRGKRSVNYCPHCKTTISDNENVYKPQNTYLWYIRYPFVDGSGEVVVATTRPETIFGDTAVAVNPKDKRFKDFVGKQLQLPLTNRTITLIADDYCEIGFGTGAVKITPAHDPNDYEVGLRHNLEIISCIDDDGRLNKQAGKFAGQDRIEARAGIEKALADGGFLVKKEKYKNQVGTCERCGSITEPKISTQWFVKMKQLAQPAIQAVKTGQLRFYPKRFEKPYLNWLENIQDWCISRQIWLGHRIPVYTCDKCGTEFVSEDEPTKCPKCGCTHLTQDSDVLDTWFSSALWPFSTMGYPDKTKDLEYYYPTSTLVTGADIITFWVSKMVFSGIEFTGKVPFRDVVINGLVRDANGVKMSKHLGNGIDPLDVIRDYGTDALRLSLISGLSIGTDLKYGIDKAKESKIFINKLYNAGKFVLQNLDGLDKFDIDPQQLKQKDKWILAELDNLIKHETKCIDRYALGVAIGALQEFTISKFCDWYIELAKVDLQGNDVARKRTVQAVLLHTLTTLLKLFHPFIPFVTEQIYLQLPNAEQTIMLSAYPTAGQFGSLKNNFKDVLELVRAIRNARSEFSVPDNKRTNLMILPQSNSKLLQENLAEIARLGFGIECNLIKTEPTTKCVKVLTNIASVFIPMGQLVDNTQQLARIDKEIASLQFEIQRSSKMLANAGFVAKAPAKLVEQEQQKLAKNKQLLAKLEADKAKYI